MQQKIQQSILVNLEKFVEKSQLENIDLVGMAKQESVRMNAIVKYCKEEKERCNKSLITVLEVGIGYAMVTSSLAVAFKPEEIDVYATEHPGRDAVNDPKFIAHLKETNTSLDLLDIKEIPWKYRPDFFDIIVFSETIEHIDPTLAPMLLMELSNSLKKDGLLILSTPNLAKWGNRSRLLRGKAIFDEAIPLPWAGGTYAHIRLYTPTELACLANRYSLSEVRREYFDFGEINKTGLKKFIYKFVYRMFPAFSPDFFILLRKSK